MSEMRSNIYDDVELLQEKVAALEEKVQDTGWITLPLTEGVTPYSENAAPMYRKVGNRVMLKGAVKNVLAAGSVGTLPEGFRPVGTGHSYVQNTSQTPEGAQFARLTVELNGNVTITNVSPGASYGAEKWFPIHTEFLID